jgi:hypothetical protein
MADESKKSSDLPTGETNNPMTDEEIGKLSDLISDSNTAESKFNGDDTSSFTRHSDEDTGEFKPFKD